MSVAEESGVHRLEAARPHRRDHRLGDVDRDDARDVRRNRLRERAGAGAEVDDRARLVDPERL
jgi:hypothetical protein